jgi:hypothetical protein
LIHVSQVRVQWWTIVYMIVDIRVPWNVGLLACQERLCCMGLVGYFLYKFLLTHNFHILFKDSPNINITFYIRGYYYCIVSIFYTECPKSRFTESSEVV